MRAWGRRASAVALVAVLAMLGARGARAAAGDDSCAQVGAALARLPSPAPGDTLRLPHRLIAAASLRVSDGRTEYRPGIDYFVDAADGYLIWIGARPDSATLIATYRFVPWAIRGSWGARSAALPETLAVVAPAPPGEPLPPGATLAIGGSKTFGLEFGNRRDARLTQSLDLTLRGTLAPGVEVRGVLTDRTTPLQPEGTTTELEDLDQVLIEVTSPWGALRLGDVEVEQHALRFLTNRRAMEGVRATGGAPGRFEGSGAIGRGAGRHLRLEFFGVEGKQGPYRVLDRLPGEDAVVVAGTERVWLDGAPQQRGEEADYTIDYAAGEVTFTARRVIRSVSEIRVECQVREGVFDRSYYALGGAAGDSTRGLAFGWLRESDDPNHALAVALTPAERDSLRRAGDRQDAIVSGVRPDSLGDYALAETDSVAAPFYLYIAEQPDPAAYGARYAVVFTDIGAGHGDYDASISAAGRTFYRFVGHLRGRFVPGRRIQVPEARDLLAARAGGDLGGGLTLTTEGAVSRHDRNTLSPSDDADNVGGALSLDGAWRLSRLWGARSDALLLRLSGRSVQKNFSPVEPLDPAFFYRRWNASSDSVLDGHDTRGAVALAVRPRRDLRLETEWEGVRAVRDFEGGRWHLTAQRTGRWTASGELWRTLTTESGAPGTALRRRLAAGWKGPTQAEATYESEALRRGRAAADAGTRFQSFGLRVASDRWVEGLNAEFVGEWRRDWVRTAGTERRDADRGLYQTDLRYAGGGALAHLLYARRQSRDAATGRTGTTDLADWSIARQDPDARVTGDWRGRLTVEENRLRVEQLQKVPAGEGHYDSLGRFVGRGDYELYFQPGDSSALETDLETAVRARVRPGAGFETSVFARVNATTPEPPDWLLSEVRRWFGGETGVRHHERQLRGEAAWLGPPRAPTPRVRWEERRGVERGASGFTRRSLTRERTIELSWVPREAVRTRLDLSGEDESEGVGEAAADARHGWTAGLELGWSPTRRILLRTRGESGRERFEPAGLRRTPAKASLGLELEPYRSGRVAVNWERIWASGPSAPAVPFFVVKPGWNLTANGSIQPKSGLSLTLTFRVDREDGHDAVMSGRMDARAYF